MVVVPGQAPERAPCPSWPSSSLGLKTHLPSKGYRGRTSACEMLNPLTFQGWSEPTRALFVSLNTKVVPNKLITELNAVTQALCSDHLGEHKKTCD